MKAIIILQLFLVWLNCVVVGDYIVAGGSGTATPFSWQLLQTSPGYLDTNTEIAGVSYNFVSNYNISDWFFDFHVMEKDCSTTPSIPYPSTFTQAYESVDDGFNSIEYILLYNQGLVESTSQWTSNATGGDFDFCVVLNMYLEPSLKTKVATHNTIYQIQVHNSDLRVIADSPTNEEYVLKDYQEEILVYQCDDSFNAIINTAPVHEGELLQICIETDTDSKFEVRSVLNLSVSQGGEKNYTYVGNDQTSPLSITRCTDLYTESARCLVKMKLLASYYENSNPTVDLNGTVRFDYIPRRRSLSSYTSGSNNEIQSYGSSSKNIQGTFQFQVQLENDESKVRISLKITKKLVSFVMMITYLTVIVFA